MHIPTHAVLGWLWAETAEFDHRDRCLVFVAGVAPDIDGLSLLFGAEAFRTWHRVLAHHLTAAIVYSLIAMALANKRSKVFLWALLGFHLHLLCDYLGSASPDGQFWTVPYFTPFHDYEAAFPWQWRLASWQNITITIVAMLVSIHLACLRGRSILSFFSAKIDTEVVKVFRQRWPLYSAASNVAQEQTELNDNASETSAE